MLGIGLMLLAAFCNASASVLQRKASRSESSSEQFSLHMFWDLVQRPTWVLGILTMLTGFLLHAVSISVSQLALVQPLLVAELPFTLVLAAFAFHLPVNRRDWAAIGLACLGLASFLGCLAPHGGSAYDIGAWTWIIAIAATVTGIVVLVVLGYFGRDEHRAALLGVATGVVFGLNSSLIAGVGAAVSHGGSLFLTWQTYGVALIAPISFYLLQNALAAGNLVASQPGLTLTNPLVAVAFGLVVYGEQTRGGIFIFGAIAGAVLIAAGTMLLARSDLLNPDANRTGHQGGATKDGTATAHTPRPRYTGDVRGIGDKS